MYLWSLEIPGRNLYFGSDFKASLLIVSAANLFSISSWQMRSNKCSCKNVAMSNTYCILIYMLNLPIWNCLMAFVKRITITPRHGLLSCIILPFKTNSENASKTMAMYNLYPPMFVNYCYNLLQLYILCWFNVTFWNCGIVSGLNYYSNRISVHIPDPFLWIRVFFPLLI